MNEEKLMAIEEKMDAAVRKFIEAATEMNWSVQDMLDRVGTSIENADLCAAVTVEER